MDRFQIIEVTEQLNHAGTKATADVAVVAKRMGFRRAAVRMCTTEEGFIPKIRRQIGFFQDWKKVYRMITDGAQVLLQHPFHYPQLTREKTLRRLKQEKHVKFISLVHDVEELRGFRYNDYYKREFEFMLDIADVIIVHNSRMKEFFLQRGVDESRLIELEIFDYLQKIRDKKPAEFERSLTIAGNLDTTKCGYIYQLGELEGVPVNLFGPNYNKEMDRFNNIRYCGSYPADEVPAHLVSGFGLVWDGESIHGCQGLSGQYLKYNNPHKLSLYLSSGLPVIIWSQAAEADFVRNNRLGICVDDLNELGEIFKHMGENDYDQMRMNAADVQKKLVSGYYAKKALRRAVKYLERE